MSAMGYLFQNNTLNCGTNDDAPGDRLLSWYVFENLIGIEFLFMYI